MQNNFLKIEKNLKKIFNSAEIMERLLDMTDTKNEYQFCQKYNLSPSTVSTWKKRDNINLKEIYEKIYGLDFNKLLYDVEENNYSIVASEPEPEYTTEKRFYSQQELETLLKAAKYEVYESVKDVLIKNR